MYVSDLLTYFIFLFGLLSGIGITGVLLSRPRVRYTTGPRCEACDYDLAATPPGRRCPECGSWARTTAAGSSWFVRYDGGIKLWCIILAPVCSAVTFGVIFWPPGPAYAETVFLGTLATISIPIAGAIVTSRTRASEFAILIASATISSIVVVRFFLHDVRQNPDPFGSAFMLCCGPLIGAGPAGLGGGLGGLVIWLRSEYAERR
ncbi:MAG: hypothetical protein IT436_13790 [Phycisphaerales bacterium]|nr:hypothetical protein [Phycisphaerales bacterium]